MSGGIVFHNSRINAVAEQAYTGNITWDGTPPSGTTTNTYAWCMVGNMVTLRINLKYSTLGVTNTTATLDLPADCPTPKQVAGAPNINNLLYVGSGGLASQASNLASNGRSWLANASTLGGGFVVVINSTSTGVMKAYATIVYFTS